MASESRYYNWYRGGPPNSRLEHAPPQVFFRSDASLHADVTLGRPYNSGLRTSSVGRRGHYSNSADEEMKYTRYRRMICFLTSITLLLIVFLLIIGAVSLALFLPQGSGTGTSTDACANVICGNGGTCQEGTCYCAPGFAGSRCETEVNQCSSTTCQYGGTCQQGTGTYTCQCADGFTGTNCEIGLPQCNSNTCLNGATCISSGTTIICTCAEGWTGETCSENVDECATNLCSFGGTCVDGVAGYTCICTEGRTGNRCLDNIQDCKPDACSNGNGVCTDGLNSFTCSCFQGYTGTICDIDINDCVGTLCLNGGTCMDDVNGFSCKCAPGYTGRTCNIDVDECSSTPCMNGGTCTNLINDYSCQCVTGYTDTNCTTDVDECSSTPCMNGGTCTNLINDYSCQCVTGYTDTNCTTEVKCGSPGNGTNTESISITEGDPEEVYNYTCSHGFRLDPDNLTVVCQLNTNGTIASWSLTPPTCSKVKCGSPGNGTNTESISITEGNPEESYNYTCSHGFRLDPNNLTVVCQLNSNGTIASWSLPPPTCSTTAKIFVTDEDTEYKIFVADLQDDLDFTHIPSTKQPRSITYDSVEKKIYWADKETERVYRADVDGENREEVTSESSDDLFKIRGIAIAESSRILYVSKWPREIRSVFIGQGSAFPRELQTKFVENDRETPNCLEVDEEQGFLYWTEAAIIKRKPLNGSGSMEIVFNAAADVDLYYISGLSIDLSRDPRRIFFSDNDKKRSFYKDLNQSYHELTDYMIDPDINDNNFGRDISYFNGKLYWTVINTGSHRGIAVMTNYDQSSRSFDVKENLGIVKPYHLHITNVNP